MTASLGIVLVHGGAHGAWCWSRTVPHLRSPALAVDLPPKVVRGAPAAEIPPEIARIGLDDFASSALADVDAAGFGRFVLVGHSMGGLTIAEIARRVPERVAHLIFVSCLIPPEAGSMIDALPEEVREMTRAAVARACAGDLAALGVGMDEDLSRHMFCNDMDPDQARFVLEHCGAEAPSVFTTTVCRRGIPSTLPKTYLRLLRDQALCPEVQDVQIAHLRESPGGSVDVVEIDAGHDVMVSRPEALADVLNAIVEGRRPASA
jgi:pimeloyl-ACP methyl ester carboxylesterase